MAVTIDVRVDAPEQVIATWGAGALVRWEYSELGVTYLEGGTEAVVAGTTLHRIEHAAGGPSWSYRSRFSRASPSTAADYSAYATVTQAEDSTDYASIDLVKDRLNLTGTTDDGRIERLLGSVHRFMSNRIGLYIGPSSDTSRTMDGREALGRLLWIPGGIRTWTVVEVAPSTGSTWETVTLADVVAYPARVRPGDPYPGLEFLDVVTGSCSSWPSGMRNVRITGTFGFADVPDDLVELATRLTIRMWLSRSSGQSDVVGSDQLGNAVVSRFMSKPDYDVLDYYARRFGPLTV